MNSQLSPYAVAYLITTIVAGLVAVAAWQRRSVPGGWPLTLLMLAAAEWAGCNGMEAQAAEIPAKIIWSQIQYAGMVNLPVLWLIFTLRYTRQGDWLTRHRWRVAALWIIPLLTLALAVTNARHGLIWPRVYLPSDSTTGLAVYEHGAGFVLFFVYCYTLVLVGTFALLRAIVRFPDLYRRQAWAIVLGAAFPIVGNSIYLLGFGPIPGLDVTPLAFTLTGAVMMWSLSHYRLLDLTPIARDVLIENMSDGVLVLDDQNRIVDMNPAMRRYIDPTLASPIGQPVETALTARPDLIAQYLDSPQAQTELCLGKESPRYLDLRQSPLHDKRGRQTGRLLVLRDVTTRKQAEAALHDQRALAEALRDTAQALNSTLDLDQVLDRILENVGRVVPHDAANILLMDAQREFACMARAQGYDRDPRRSGGTPANRVRVNDVPNLRQMTETRQPIVVSDAQASPNWVVFEGTR